MIDAAAIRHVGHRSAARGLMVRDALGADVGAVRLPGSRASRELATGQLLRSRQGMTPLPGHGSTCVQGAS